MRIRPDLPLHPILVHFPIAFWTAVPVLDLVGLVSGGALWHALAAGAAAIGVVAGAAAIVTGLSDYLQPSLAGIDLRLAARHGVRTSLAWGVFAARLVLAAVLSPAGWGAALFLLVDLLGCALLAHGVVFGTRQVYRQLTKD